MQALIRKMIQTREQSIKSTKRLVGKKNSTNQKLSNIKKNVKVIKSQENAYGEVE